MLWLVSIEGDLPKKASGVIVVMATTLSQSRRQAMCLSDAGAAQEAVKR